MDKEKLPSIIFFPRREDGKNVDGRGDIKFYNNEEWQESYRHSLSGYAQSLYEDIFEKEKKYPNLPNIAKVRMKEKAIAKSHKPNKIFSNSTCPIIGAGKLDEIYIKVTSSSIQNLKKEIDKTKSEAKRANISKIESITPYDLNSIVDISSLKDSIKKGKPLKLKFFDFQNDQDNTKTYNMFIENFGTETDIKKIKYSENLDIYRILLKDDNLLDSILSFPGVKYISAFSEYELIQSELKAAESNLENLTLPEEGFDYPIVGLIDSGISLNNSYLSPWIYDKIVKVPALMQDNSHGTFVAGMIVYGGILNGYEPSNLPCKILDVVAVPRGGRISEEDLKLIIEEAVSKYSDKVKIWNLSMGADEMCGDSISDFAIFLDDLQKKYSVKFVISAGNLNNCLRCWEPTGDEDYDVISSPADSILGITVGSIAQKTSPGFVEKECPSPFSRRGPGPNFTVKPDLVHYGGNCDTNGNCDNLGVISFDVNGNLVEGIGTSYSTPIISGILANIYNTIDESDDRLLLAKSLLVNNSYIPIKSTNANLDLFRYYGFGKIEKTIENIVYCSESEVQMILNAKIQEGRYIEIMDFPYPKSLFKNGKWFGEIKITLSYNPPLDSDYGQEYCRTNIDLSLGTYTINEETGEISYSGAVPLEKKWYDKYEKQQVENGFKWNPVKSYSRRISRGVTGDGWKLRLDCMGRLGVNYVEQDVLIVINIKDPKGGDIYSEIINELTEKAFVHQELAVNNSIRLRN